MLTHLQKFYSSKWFSEDVSQLILIPHIVRLNLLVFHILSYEVMTSVDMLRTAMLYWIFGEDNGWLIVHSIPLNSLTNQFSHVPWHAAKVAAMYSASHDDNATVFCFWDAQLISISPRKNTFLRCFSGLARHQQNHCRSSLLVLPSIDPSSRLSHSQLSLLSTLVLALVPWDVLWLAAPWTCLGSP